ncbi:DUF6545 domain-containing protein [Agromyces bauzanensis]|uniref:DUF6545 domain-containing protein n=1 Tax=Agromyces bauzanensis TaxID=1308924 RepID=A0A917PGP0_9MICO|nr:DUF6545 domain-containing protein [Agromyces bauzanensis]GGJ76588.1 hypothetical protein GCM10011372_13500 [Agromyces bauzanensis]
MIPVLVSALMWLLLACLLILRRGRGERSVTYAALVIAIAMTLNIDPIYVALDGLVGTANLVTLLADLALTVGVFFLGRGVMKASDHQPRFAQLALGTPALATALVSAVVAFFLIDRGSTTTTFMLDLGYQPAAAAYSVIHFAYYAIVLTAMAVLAARQLRVNRGVQLLPPASLVLGSAFGFALTAVVITMDVAHVAGNLDLMTAVSVAYNPLYLLTFLFLCFGFAGQPVARTLHARSRERATRALARELEPLWARATAVRPGISQSEDAPFHADDGETLLHRQVVEIRDAMIDTRVSFEVSDDERGLVERAERHLLGAGPGTAAWVAHGQPSVGWGKR